MGCDELAKEFEKDHDDFSKIMVQVRWKCDTVRQWLPSMASDEGAGLRPPAAPRIGSESMVLRD